MTCILIYFLGICLSMLFSNECLHRIFELKFKKSYLADSFSMKGQVLVYSTTGCPHCIAAKNSLSGQGINYIDINLADYTSVVADELKKHSGKSSVPQIYFNEIHIGGNDDLQKLMKDDKQWKSMIELVNSTPAPSSAPKPPKEEQRVFSQKNTSISGFTCEPDACSAIVRELKKSKIITVHKRCLVPMFESFQGADFVKWCMTVKKMDKENAMKIGQGLIDNHFVFQMIPSRDASDNNRFVDDDRAYRLLECERSDALNAGNYSECAPLPANQISQLLRRVILDIYSKYLSTDGKSVDYTGIGQSEEFKKYVSFTRELQRVNIRDISKAEKLAFFINIYNALVIHGYVAKGPPKNILSRWRFFNNVRYIIGGYPYNLQEMENGILRSNRKGVGMISNPFSNSDPRIKLILDDAEPLIHFALVCGAKSCPPIKTYSAESVYKELQMAAESFLDSDDSIQIISSKQEVQLSKIFDWYGVDFGKKEIERVQWICDHMQAGEKRNTLQALLSDTKSSVKVSYQTYNWDINA